MAFIPNETPTGAIDGVNKVYTLANNVSVVSSLAVNGAPYFDFSITGANEITLIDAPTASIVIYYFTAPATGASGYIVVSDLRDLVERDRDDTLPEVSDQLFLDWCNFINFRTFNLLSEQDPEQIIGNSTVNVVSGTSTYALPATFGNVRAVGTGLFKTDQDGNITNERLPMSGVGSPKEGYYVNLSNIVLTPSPTNTSTLILRYIPNLTKLTATTETMFIQTPFEEYAVRAIVSLYEAWKESPNSAFQDQNFVRALDELLDNYRQMSYVVEMPNVGVYY